MRLYFLVLIVSISQLSAQVSNSQLLKDQHFIETNLLPATMVKGRSITPETLKGMMKSLKVPGISVAVVKSGKLLWAKSYGQADTKTGKPVDVNTLFQAGSISKPLAALAALKLVDEGKINLDSDVNEYLTSWQIPDYDFEEKVTLRRLLTHSAGVTVHGFPGYSDKDNFPTDNDVLDGKGNTDRIFVDTEPGSLWRYSGGGYTIMEKIVEDVSGMTLANLIQSEIFPTLKMNNSTFFQPLPATYRDNVSLAYNRNGKIIDGSYHHYPEQAAAGLWTTPSDLVNYITHVQGIYNNEIEGILSFELTKEMLTPHMNDWGLGPSIRMKNNQVLFGHGGKNAGFTNRMIASLTSGDGIVIMTNADNGNDIITKLQIAISEYYKMDIASSEILEIVPIGSKSLERFVGKYEVVNTPSMKAKVKAGKDNLIVNFRGKHEIEYLGGLLFVDLKNPERIEFIEDSQGEISGFKVLGPGIEFKKLN